MTLAKRFNGEVINADALQIYAGLPIITNKIPLRERRGVVHHLLGCIDPKEEPWTVRKFVTRARSIIEEIRARGKLPIVVGGTHYYTQGLLFDESTLESSIAEKLGHMELKEQEQKWPILASSTADILTELKRVDPEMASKWHPNDNRKIRRSLEIYLQTGKKASEIYREQQNSKQDSTLHNETIDGKSPVQETAAKSDQPHPTLRYNALILWIHAERPFLKARLNARVESMIASGLLEEIQAIRTLYPREQSSPTEGEITDLTRGIWVAIGYKEFAEYSSALEQGDADEKRLTALLKYAAERTQAATRQYANSQARWRVRLLQELRKGAKDTDSRRLYVLDGTHVEQYPDKVEKVASDLVESFVIGKEMSDPMSISEIKEALRLELMYLEEEKQKPSIAEKIERECPICGVILVTPSDRNHHMNSRKHSQRVKKLDRALKEKMEKGSRKNMWCSGDW